MMAQVQMEMNSVERIQEYSSLDSEDYKQDLGITGEGAYSSTSSGSSSVVTSPLVASSGKRTSLDVGKGRVEFRNIFMKYHTSSVPVLRYVVTI